MAPPFFPIATESCERDAVTEVLPSRLFVTNWRGASDGGGLRNLGVTHIAAIGDEFVEDRLEGMTYLTQDITDNADQAATMRGLLRDTSAFIDEAVRGGGAALVHCAAGASRSATVVLAYLVLHAGMPLRQAFAHLWGRRPATWPNDGFMEVLIGLEQEHSGRPPTLTMAEYIEWGDWDGPAEGEEPSMPVLLRLQRQDTRLETEIRKSEAEEEARLGQLAGQLGPHGTYQVDGETKKLSLNRAEREAQARRASAEARRRR